MNQEYVQNIGIELSEQCRKALEKHYGGTIPMQEEFKRRVNLKKKSKSSVKVAASNVKINPFASMRKWIAEKDAQASRRLQSALS